MEDACESVETPGPRATAPGWIGFLAGAVPILCLVALAAIWPGDEARLTLGPEGRLMAIAALAGALGGALQMARAYAAHRGRGSWNANWVPWYGLRIPAGIGFALVFYFALSAGLYNPNAIASAVNPYGVATLCSLAGLFSAQALEKLEELFETLTGRRDAVLPVAPPPVSNGAASFPIRARDATALVLTSVGPATPTVLAASPPDQGMRSREGALRDGGMPIGGAS